MLEVVLFYSISFLTLLFSIGVITSRSAVYSVLCLVAAMGLMAGLFVMLKAFLVATILILVYAGAILVLFLFVVMLIDFRKISSDWKGFSLAPALAVFLGVAVFLQSFKVIQSISLPAVAPVHGTAQSLGLLLFQNYALPFELTSFLLLSAVVSVVVLAKKDHH